MIGTITFAIIIYLFVKYLFSSKSIKASKQIQKDFPKGKSENSYYLFLDIESTGLMPLSFDFEHRIEKSPRIVQIAWRIFDPYGNCVKDEDFIIKQKNEVPKGAFEIHGISKKRSIEEGVEFNEMAKILIKDLKEIDVIVAHNARYDVVILQAEFLIRNLNYSLKKKEIHCTMLNTTSYCKIKKTNGYSGYKWPKLEELVQKVYVGNFNSKMKLEGLHDASNDVWLTAKCYFMLLRDEFKFRNNSRKVWEGLSHPKYLETL